MNHKLFVWAIVFLLLAVNFLTFHDLFEQHTLRDWLTLAASILVFIYFARNFEKK